MSACAIRPSMRRSQCTCEPRPIGTSKPSTSTTPPSESPSLAAAFDRRRPSRPRRAASKQRTDDSSIRARSSRPGRGASAGTAASPMRTTWREHRGPELGEQRLRQRAGGDPRRGLAGAGALEHVAGVVEAVLLHADEVGVPGPRLGERLLGDARARATSPPATSATRCCGSRSTPASRACAPWRTPPSSSTSSRSKRIRGPRPKPRRRRASSSPIASTVTVSPAGQALDHDHQGRAVRFPGGEVAEHGPLRLGGRPAPGPGPNRPRVLLDDLLARAEGERRVGVGEVRAGRARERDQLVVRRRTPGRRAPCTRRRPTCTRACRTPPPMSVTSRSATWRRAGRVLRRRGGRRRRDRAASCRESWSGVVSVVVAAVAAGRRPGRSARTGRAGSARRSCRWAARARAAPSSWSCRRRPAARAGDRGLRRRSPPPACRRSSGTPGTRAARRSARRATPRRMPLRELLVCSCAVRGGVSAISGTSGRRRPAAGTVGGGRARASVVVVVAPGVGRRAVGRAAGRCGPGEHACR